MQGFALVLFFLAIFFQFCEILSENQTILSETSESQRPKRNHENDSSQYRKQVQSETLSSKDACNKKAQLCLVKDDPECYKQETRKSNDFKNMNRLVVDVHDGYGNNHQKHLGAKVSKINPLSVSKIPKQGMPLTVLGKVNSVQKIAVESNTRKTATAAVAKHQHHIVIVKPDVEENDAKNKEIEDNKRQLKIQVDTGKENKAQDVTYEKSNTKTPCNLELEDLKSNNILEMKEHKYEEIRITPTKYYPQAHTRNLKAIPDFNSDFGSDLPQANPYQEMGYGYDENNNYYICANNVDQGHQNCYTADFKRDPYIIGNEESKLIKKTWLDTEIKMKMQNLNQETNPWYSNVMMDSYQNGASNALSNKLYQNSYQYR